MSGEDSLPEFINDRYKVKRLLGKGGMGQVFLVEDTRRENALMALKTLLPSTTDRLLTSGFRDEFAELAKLQHANLARAYDFGKVAATSEHFFTTEFISGVELADAINDATNEQFINIAAQVLRGLDFIHQNGILHNDLKPANILLTQDDDEDAQGMANLQSLVYGHKGQVKLIDFGLISREHTAWDRILGTLRYISPERILRKNADRRSDIYSIGCVFFVLFGRRPPFSGNDQKALLKLHLEAPPPDLAALRPDLPPVVAEMVRKCMAKDPADRFQNASEALDMLGSRLGWDEHEVRSETHLTGESLSAGSLLHRDREVRILSEAFASVAKSKPDSSAPDSHAIVVEGDKGVGKSRLVEELRSLVQTSDGTFVIVSCDTTDETLQPVADALVSSLQISGARGLDKLRAKLDAKVESGDDLSNLLETVVLRYTRKSPLLLQLDDFDQASEPVVKFARELLHAADTQSRESGDGGTRKLLIVVTGMSGTARELGISGIPEILLERFTREQSESFIRSVFGGDDVPQFILDTLTRTAGGNPLFMLELVDSLVDSGKVSCSGLKWKFPESLEDLKLPDTLDGLFAEKIASLPSSLREVMQWIAISGRPLNVAILERCVVSEDGQCRSWIRNLVERDLLIELETEDGSSALRLAHAGYREILLSPIDDERASQMHQRVAQNTEAAYPDWSLHSDALASHWLESGNSAGFLRFASEAAELLRNRGNFEMAVSYHQRIVEAVPENQLAKKIQSLVKLSEMHEFLWHLEDCICNLKKIRRLGERVMKPQDKALLTRRLACVEMARFQFGKARELLEQVSSQLHSAPILVRCCAEAPLTVARWFTGAEDEARNLAERLDREIEGTSAPENEKEKMLLLSASNHLASFHQIAGELAQAASLFGKNLVLLEDIKGQQQALGATHCALGSVLLDRGDYAAAVDHLKSALRIGKEIGDRRTLCRARERLGEYYLRFGKYREALQTSQVGLQDAKDIDNSAAVSNSLRTLAQIYLTANDLATAKRTIKRAISMSADSGDLVSRGMARLGLSRILLEEGNLEDAKEQIQLCESESLSFHHPLLSGISATLSYRLEWLESGEENRLLLDKARSNFSRHGYQGELVELSLLECEIATTLNESERAADVLTRLAKKTEQYKSPDLRCEASLLRAMSLPEQGETGKALALMPRIISMARSQNKLLLVAKCNHFVAALDREMTH